MKKIQNASLAHLLNPDVVFERMRYPPASDGRPRTVFLMYIDMIKEFDIFAMNHRDLDVRVALKRLIDDSWSAMRDKEAREKHLAYELYISNMLRNDMNFRSIPKYNILMSIKRTDREGSICFRYSKCFR